MVCPKCGLDAETSQVELARDGYVIHVFESCGPCFDESLAGARRLRHEFEAMLDRGVSRAEANRILIERMERGEAP